MLQNPSQELLSLFSNGIFFSFPNFHKLFFTSSPTPSSCIPHNHHFFLICRSKSEICASIKKPKARRKVKSNDDLCNDIREYLSSVGLPEDHVPTMKELSQHGRNDSLSTEYLAMTEGRISVDTEHQKELEIAHLKQQIEEEKRLLSILQIKAETEIREARQLISEKDAELNAAEDSLSGLKEVEILYWADGENVEVAGSFNGWHHKIKMDPQESSDPIGEDIQASSDIEDIQASLNIVDPISMRNSVQSIILGACPVSGLIVSFSDPEGVFSCISVPSGNLATFAK